MWFRGKIGINHMKINEKWIWNANENARTTVQYLSKNKTVKCLKQWLFTFELHVTFLSLYEKSTENPFKQFWFIGITSLKMDKGDTLSFTLSPFLVSVWIPRSVTLPLVLAWVTKSSTPIFSVQSLVTHTKPALWPASSSTSDGPG